MNEYTDNQRNEVRTLFRKAIRRENMVVVLLLAGFFVMQYVISQIVILLQLARSGGLSEIMNDVMREMIASSKVDMGSIMDETLNAMEGVSPGLLGLISLISMAAGLPLFLVLRKKRLFTSDLVEKREKMPPTLFLKIFVVAMGAQWIFSAVSMVFEYVLGQFGLSAMTLYASSMNALMNPIGLLYAMLLGPIMEEIIFRGAIMKHLERFGANYAIVMSSLFFGLYHIYLYQAAFAFLVGAILAYTAHRYSIRWSMLLHILINSSALGTEFLFGAETAIYVMFAICIVSVFLLVRNRSILREQIARGKPAMPNAFRYAFSGVSVIVVFAAFIVANITMIAVSTQ